MKKDIFKNSKKYSISIVELNYKEETFQDEAVRTINCKYISELKKKNSLVKEHEFESFSNSQMENPNGFPNGNPNEASDFETAIKATEFGKFNCLILFAAFWGYMSSMYATTSMSLILPSAECDLSLSNFDKGMLNSVIYIGMIASAFFWGFISDAVGRKKVLMVAFGLDAFFSVLVGLAQNFTLLIVAKLFTGFISSGPIAILASFLAENHANTYRASVLLCSGMFTSTATITLPLLAWLIIPQNFYISLFDGYIFLPTWRIFLLVAALPSFFALISLFFLDESPKFLMFQGKNEEAMKVFRRIYNMNTGKPGESFPIMYLKDEMGNDQTKMNGNKPSFKEVINTGCKQMKPIFKKPQLPKALLPCVIQFCTLCGVNTLRLWSPQLFASAIEKEKFGYNLTDATTVCELLGNSPRTDVLEEIVQCGKYLVSDKVYFNTMITGVVTGIGYLISSYIVRTVEKKWLMIMAYSLSISCLFGLYFSTTSDYMLGVISVFISLTSTSATAVISAVIDIFPTSLRTTAVSLCMTFGRMGALVGNIVFPVLLDLNCVAPLILLGVALLGAALLALFLPKTKGKHLE